MPNKTHRIQRFRARLSLVSALLFTFALNEGLARDFPLGKTFFQTNCSFDPLLAIPTDFVVVHRHGAQDIGDSLKSWELHGYPAARMFFIGSDAGRIYTGGGFDGKPHLNETETRQDGSIIECAGVRPYMVPTEGWTRYVREMTAYSIDQGARAIFPEEPLAHTQSGYSEALKNLWQNRYQEPWCPPHSSPEAFWKASRLKSDLYYDLVDAALDEVKQAEARTGREFPFVLPIHSLLSHASGHMVYPSGRSLDLIEKGLDGFVGQVWTGPIAWSMSQAEGRRMNRDEDFFESAYLLYSYFANLTFGTEAPCFFLADPVEDDPQFEWEDYKVWYQKSLVTMLLFPWVDHFELMPWPDRVFQPGHSMGGGSPGPEEYRRTLIAVFEALREISKTEGSDFDRSANPTLGYLVNDTLGWQRGGPEGSRMESIHGLTVPLLKRGIQIQVVPLERSSEARFLDRFDLLVLSYDMMKPLSESHHSDLVDWVQRGGTLLYVGQANAYDSIDSWWRSEGFDSPADHLRSRIEAIPSNWKVHSESPFPLEERELGRGKIIWIGVESSRFAESSEWTKSYLDLLTRSFRDRHIDLFQGRPMSVQRGAFRVVRTTQASMKLTGWYLNLLDPQLSPLKDPSIDPNSFAFYKSIELPAGASVPGVLVSAPVPQSATLEYPMTTLNYRFATGTPWMTRISPGDHRLKEACFHQEGKESEVRVSYDPDSRSYLFIGGEVGTEGTLEIHWE